MARQSSRNRILGIESPSPCEVAVQPSLKAYFGYCLYKAALRLRFALDQKLEKHGLIAPQLGVMRVLDTDVAMSQIEIGRELGIDRASMVKLIDHLEKSGIVARKSCREDRRVNKVSLTAAGRKVLKLATELRIQAEDEFLAPLSPEEKRILLQAIPKLL
jgi:DNA-binding MarR family transcriptional regulator